MEHDCGWDLQAVVRGCGGTAAAAAAEPSHWFSPLMSREHWGEQDDLAFCFPDLFAPRAEINEVDELWKPFLSDSPSHQIQQQPPPPPPPPPPHALLSPRGSSCSSSAPPLLPALPLSPPQFVQRTQQRALSHASKPKRRKTQQKRVVQVPAEGLSSDLWAWRKYGQKPIKGSPHPRGYYRCSSSKGCPARKQVERSRADPGMFLLAYAGEHNHPMPTHRNSLAGSTRQKFPSAAANPTDPAHNHGGTTSPGGPPAERPDRSPLSSSSLSAAGALSPATPLAESEEEEEELLRLPRRRREGEGGGGEEEDGEDLLLDMEVLGEGDMLILGFGGPREADPSSSGNLGLPAPWTASNSAAARR